MVLRRNILLFHQAALGDFIVTWPLALGLARVFAQSRVFYVTAGQKGALAEKALRIDSSDVESGWGALFAPSPVLPERPAKLLAGAQTIIDFTARPNDVWAQNVSALAPEAAQVALSTNPPDSFAGHISEFLVDQLKPWPVMHAAADQMLKSVQSRGIGPAGVAGGPVVLHPGAGSPGKCWAAHRFLELTGRLKSAGREVRVLIGEVERERWPAGQIAEFARVAEVREPATLVDLMREIAGAGAFVGNDSGPAHLAGILGVRTVSLFGPRDPARWKPLGPAVRVVTGEWEYLTPQRVVEQLDAS